MANSPLFYRYYDVLFTAKDYAGEVTSIFSYYSVFSEEPLTNILEVGCGTGNHTLQLAHKSGVRVMAVDTDLQMLALAQFKVERDNKTNISFATTLNVMKNADLCVALFNVVNYICGDESLCKFFADIAESLSSKGIFIFDCWNGTAVQLDPPGSKYYEQFCDGQKISCLLTSHTDVINGITTLNYQLELFGQSGEKLESGDFQIVHRLWTPAQFKEALGAAGLEVETVCIPFKFEQAATDTDWKIMFVCRKA